MPELEPHYAGLPAEAREVLRRNPIHLVLDNIRSAYNVGSAFRTADAVAAEHVHLCGMSAYPPHHKLEKTALGAFEYVPWTYYERTRDCIEGLRAQGVHVAGIEVRAGALSYVDFAWPQPVAVVFGNEVTGIHERNLSRCDSVIQIPMRGYKNSINVATAIGVILYAALDRWNAF